MQVLETERLIVRHLSDDDAEFMLELLNDPAFIQNIGDRKIRSLDGARAYIQNGPVASYAKHGFGLYLVQLKETGESMGICGLIRRDQLDDVDIGYAFLPKFWSKGYAIESARAIKQYAHDVIGVKRMVAITDPNNEASIHVLEKLGMKFEKIVQLAADDIELKLFSIDLA
jgi:RimJ/RimL family protein N-acetyltransferase